MLTDLISTWLAARRAGGYSLKHLERDLQPFVVFSSARAEEHIRAATAIEWAAQAATPGQRYQRFHKVAQLARYLHAEDPRHELLPAGYFPAKGHRPVPYIYSADDERRLFEVATHLGSSETIRPHAVTAVLALLFATGLRVSEALALRTSDVTPDGLIIRETKFRKTRLVPLHVSAARGLASHLDRRRAFAGNEDHVFLHAPGKSLGPKAFRYWWDHILLASGIRPAPPARRPRIHDIRHTFAVRALESAPALRDRIDRHMLAVSTYLGHSRIADTYWYFQATPGLMSQVADACQKRFEGALP